MRTSVTTQAIGYGHWLCAMDYALSTPKEVVVVGERDDAATKALLEAVHSRFIPNKVVAGMASEDDPIADELALLEGRSLVGRPPDGIRFARTTPASSRSPTPPPCSNSSVQQGARQTHPN